MLPKVPLRVCWRYLANRAPRLALGSALPSIRGTDFNETPAAGVRACRWLSAKVCSKSAITGLALWGPEGCCPEELVDRTARKRQMQIPLYIAVEGKQVRRSEP